MSLLSAGFSAVPIFTTLMISSFNMIFTACPIVAYAVLEQDMHVKTVLANPASYAVTRTATRSGFFWCVQKEQVCTNKEQECMPACDDLLVLGLKAWPLHAIAEVVEPLHVLLLTVCAVHDCCLLPFQAVLLVDCGGNMALPACLLPAMVHTDHA
jgi:hypothetical protein